MALAQQRSMFMDGVLNGVHAASLTQPVQAFVTAVFRGQQEGTCVHAEELLQKLRQVTS